MNSLPMSILALLCASGLAIIPACAETLRFDTQILDVEPLLADDARTLTGGDPIAWLPERVEGACLITLTATVAADAEDGQAAIVFCAARPDGDDLLADPPADFSSFNCYAVTLNPTAMRLTENPGARIVDRNTRLGTGAKTEYSLAIFKSGMHIRVFVHDRLALDWIDHSAPGLGEEPLPGGYIGLCAAGARLEISHLAVRRANSSRVEMIERLYYHWYTIVDARFPGPGGYFLQTVHDP